MILKNLVTSEIQRKNFSVRAAARDAGLSHTSMVRILNEDPVEFDTLITISKWLGVKPSTLIDGLSSDGDDLVTNLAVLIERERGLADVFKVLLEEYISGGITQEEISDVVSYATYKLNRRKNAILAKDREVLSPDR
jgi:transcriptional regulator with XRE-family HTH domain